MSLDERVPSGSEPGAISPTVEQLRSLVAYNSWANRRLIEAARELSPDDLTRDAKASFGSILGTLVHIVWGEHLWLHFWQHGERLPGPAPGAFPDLAVLEKYWIAHDEEYSVYLAGLTPEDLQAPRGVGENSYALGALVQHILNHSTYHRGQVALLLRQLGREPASTDYRLFLTVTGGQTES